MKQVPLGTVFQGKWTQQSFKVAKVLGEGANGAVYLVYTKNGYAAMKVCEQAADAALEWNVLEKVSQVRASFPRPILIDDWEFAKTIVYFYIMEWVPGEPLNEALPKLDDFRYQKVVEQIVLSLATLHSTQMAFCDIKPQNILVATDGAVSVRFVDVGGVTPFGRAVRQFTPISDRAFWDLGTRRAESGYDICGLCLSLLLSESDVLPKNLYQLPPSQRQRWLHKALRRYPRAAFLGAIRRGIDGKVTDASNFLPEWQAIRAVGARNPSKPFRQKQYSNSSAMFRSTGAAAAGTSGFSGTSSTGAGGAQSTGKTRASRSTSSQYKRTRPSHAQRRAAHAADWTEWVMWTSLTVAACMTCFAWASFLGFVP